MGQGLWNDCLREHRSLAGAGGEAGVGLFSRGQGRDKDRQLGDAPGEVQVGCLGKSLHKKGGEALEQSAQGSTIPGGAQ